MNVVKTSSPFFIASIATDRGGDSLGSKKGGHKSMVLAISPLEFCALVSKMIR